MTLKKKSSGGSYHHGDLRQAVIAASVQVIQERGDVSFSVRELATIIGVSHAAVYRHFANKRAVLAAVAEEGFQLLVAALEKAKLTPGKNPIEILRKQSENYVDFALDHVGHFRAMYHGELSDKSDYPQLARLYGEAGDALTHNFSEGLKLGVFKDAKPELLTLSLWAAVHGLVDLSLQGQLPDAKHHHHKAIKQSAKKVVELLLNGLLA